MEVRVLFDMLCIFLHPNDSSVFLVVKGKRRVNVLYKRGGSALKRHLQRILTECTLLKREKSRMALDEIGQNISIFTHVCILQKVDNLLL